jgi:uncharacterized protein
MDVTPLIPAGRQVIDSYGAHSFHVSGAGYDGAILVFPERTESWAGGAIAGVAAERL